MFTLSAFQDKSAYSIFPVFLQLLVIKNEVKLERKTAYGKKIKANGLFSGKETCYRPSVCKYIHYISS